MLRWLQDFESRELHPLGEVPAQATPRLESLLEIVRGRVCVCVCVCVCAAHMLSMSNSVIMRDLFVCQGFIFTTILCFAGAHCGADIPQGVCLPVIPVCCWGSALVNEVVVTGPALII